MYLGVGGVDLQSICFSQLAALAGQAPSGLTRCLASAYLPANTNPAISAAATPPPSPSPDP